MDGELLYLPIFFIWNLWKTRNNYIFEDIAPNISRLCHIIMLDIAAYQMPQKKGTKIRNIGEPPDNLFPMAFFDGFTAESTRGAGLCIWINEQHYISIKLGCGCSTNTRVELLALWALLFIAKEIGLPYLHIFGDSSIVINWVRKNLLSLL